MRCKKPLVILFAVLLIIGLGSLPAKAEWFADLYLGPTFAQDEELDLSSGGVSQSSDIKFDSSFIVGYRIGYFFEKAPFVGLALEGSYTEFESHTELDYVGSEDVTLLALSPLLMLRLPLKKSDKYERGEWLPFIAIAPGLYKTSVIKDDSYDLGWALRLGVKKMVATNWAIGLEYRYMGFSPEFEGDVDGDDIKAETDLNLHSLLFGVSYNF